MISASLLAATFTFLNDLYVFDPVVGIWTNLSDPVAGNAPLPRASLGFVSASGRIYVQGGYGAKCELVFLQILARFSIFNESQ
jgi:hypothetical protein